MSAGDSEKVHRRGTVGVRANQVLAIVWVVVGVVVLMQSRGLKYGAKFGPGPGFLPFWMGVAFIVLGLALLAQITFSRKEWEDISLPSKSAAWQMFLAMCGFSGFVLLAEKIGFLLSIGLLFLYLLVVVERREWKLSLAISIGCVLVYWAIFELGVQMNLPLGVFEFLR